MLHFGCFYFKCFLRNCDILLWCICLVKMARNVAVPLITIFPTRLWKLSLPIFPLIKDLLMPMKFLEGSMTASPLWCNFGRNMMLMPWACFKLSDEGGSDKVASSLPFVVFKHVILLCLHSPSWHVCFLQNTYKHKSWCFIFFCMMFSYSQNSIIP